MAARIVIPLADLRDGDRIWLFNRLCDVFDVADAPELPGAVWLRFRPVGPQPDGSVASAILPAEVEVAVGRLVRCFTVACLLCRTQADVVVDVAETGWPRRRPCARCAGDREILITAA